MQTWLEMIHRLSQELCAVNVKKWVKCTSKASGIQAWQPIHPGHRHRILKHFATHQHPDHVCGSNYGLDIVLQ
jgi:hypothetical protein